MTNAAKNWTICLLAASLLVVAGLSASIVQAERLEKHKLINRLERQERKVTADERSRCKVIMRRLAASCNAALKMEPQAEGEKEIRRVHNAIHRMNAALWSAWAENVDAREAVMAAMCMVAERQEELDRLWNEGKISGPQAQLKRMEWALLHSLLMDWLEALDPDFEDGPIQHGDAVGERMKQALAGA